LAPQVLEVLSGPCSRPGRPLPGQNWHLLEQAEFGILPTGWQAWRLGSHAPGTSIRKSPFS